MSNIEIVSCHDPAEFPALGRIWRRSVESTHVFLTHDDIGFYAPKVADSYLPAVNLRVARIGGRTVGFSGTDGNKLEMLFIDDNYRGRGVSSAQRRADNGTVDGNNGTVDGNGTIGAHKGPLGARSPEVA